MSTPSDAAHRPDAAVHALSGRDPRVDFFRGLAFIIILIAHIPYNWMSQWIPARWGLSDATEMFVFMSGYAAGIAFGGVYLRSGWGMGASRTLYRTWQVYLGHLLLFFFLAMTMVAATELLDTGDYVGSLNLHYFFDEARTALVGLFTLHYVPNYFDILPMYIVILLLMPLFMALGRIHPWVALGACVVLYVYNWFTGLYDLPGEIQPPAEVRPDSERRWFFNPFGWQLIFFTGFAISIGWLKPPPFRRWLMIACAAFVFLCVFLGHWQWRLAIEPVNAVWDFIHPKSVDEQPAFAKTNLWVLRYLHFLALAYITVHLLKGREHWLNRGWSRPIAQCGKQSLPVFLFAMGFSRLAGIMLDQLAPRKPDGEIDHWAVPVWQVVLVNAFWIAMLIGLAYLLGWLQATPWKRKRQPPVHGLSHAPYPHAGGSLAGGPHAHQPAQTPAAKPAE